MADRAAAAILQLARDLLVLAKAFERFVVFPATAMQPAAIADGAGKRAE
jgi:hypothetical protein